MNSNFRKTLIAGAIAALMSSSAWAVTDSPGNAPDEGAATPGTEQHRDTSPQMSPGAGEGSPGQDASRAGTDDNPLYSRTPDELTGMEVVGSDGEEIGKIDAIVMNPDQNEVHAVISSGGIMGLGAREIAVPLGELEPIDSDKVQARLTQDQVEALPEYQSDEYTELESDRPISEFSAFEPTREGTDPGMEGRDADPGMDDRGDQPGMGAPPSSEPRY